MANVIKIDIDSITKKLNAVKKDISALDITADYSSLNDEEFKRVGTILAENEAKLRAAIKEINSLAELNHQEFVRFNDSQQQHLDGIEYYDSDGTVIAVGFTSETTTTINRAQLDKETGVQVTVTGNNLDLYTKPSVRAKKKRVVDAVENGVISSACVTKTTVQQGHIVFDDSNKTKKGGE